ncbi:SMP-30/gluconolactonase/LRE family protein [Streptomyces sp. 6N223]|uniref:SMP-30/gluconolactonase/LRE family protein n=1 Tax=Streptomyces sp. 6N223 TaxID=3457412 RepID=UPI003FCF92D7
MAVDLVDLALDARTRIAEGPVWDARGPSGVLRWVDVRLGEVHAFDPSTGRDTHVEMGGRVGAVLLRAGGGLVVATEASLVACDEDGGAREPVATVAVARDGGRLNDGGCDATGRLWAGSCGGTPGSGALYRLDPDRGVHRMLTGVTTSNGLDWSPDGRTLYYNDSPTGGIDAFDHDPATGAITRRRRLADVDRGRPDGLTVDADGCVWTALWEGWAIRRYTPEGRLDRTVEIPVKRVTSLAFGGPGLDTLFVTTASARPEDGDPREQPYAGGIFAVGTRATGTTGRPPGEWAG